MVKRNRVMPKEPLNFCLGQQVSTDPPEEQQQKTATGNIDMRETQVWVRDEAVLNLDLRMPSGCEQTYRICRRYATNYWLSGIG